MCALICLQVGGFGPNTLSASVFDPGVAEVLRCSIRLKVRWIVMTEVFCKLHKCWFKTQFLLNMSRFVCWFSSSSAVSLCTEKKARVELKQEPTCKDLARF